MLAVIASAETAAQYSGIMYATDKVADAWGADLVNEFMTREPAGPRAETEAAPGADAEGVSPGAAVSPSRLLPAEWTVPLGLS